MKKNFLVVCVILMSLLISGCGPKQIGEVKTPQGAAILTSIERSQGWPQNCDPEARAGIGIACQAAAKTGYELMIINFAPKDKTADQLDVKSDANIYVGTEDGQRYGVALVGFTLKGEETKQFVIFSVPLGAKNLTLYWEDNPPIQLPQDSK